MTVIFKSIAVTEQQIHNLRLPTRGPKRNSAADKKFTASKSDLTQESFPKLFALVRPQPTEWRHLQVRWITDVIAARRQAAKEDKPMVVLYTGGAGYNEPLGIC